MAELTTAETRLAEQYVSVLDFMSRCQQAVNEGNWHYLWDKASQLERSAGTLAEIAKQAIKDQKEAGQPRPRAAQVRAAVAYWGRHYRAGRLLHPLEPEQAGR